jgi:hypothetical protein
MQLRRAKQPALDLQIKQEPHHGVQSRLRSKSGERPSETWVSGGRMNIETELIHKWGIGDDPVFGSGSLKDIQTLCNECDKLRKHNEILRAEIELLEKAVKFKPKRECSICKGNGFIDVEKYDRVEQEDCRWCGTTGIEPQPPMPEAADSDGNAPGKHFGPD